MKKILISSICLVLLLSVTIFGGCLKADNATLVDNIAKFKNDLKYLKQSDQSAGCGILDNGYNFKFIETNDSLNLAMFINSDPTFNLLNEGEEYDFILTNASSYFLSKYTDAILTIYKDNVDAIPQYLNTQLYHNIEAVTSKLKEFKQVYSNLIFTVGQNSANPASTINQKNLRKLLSKYEEVIGEVLTLNFTAQQIYDYHIIQVPTDYLSLSQIPEFEVKRLIETFSLYITNYLYQKNMVFNDVLTEDGTITKFENNALYVKFQELLTAYNSAVTGNTINNSTVNQDANSVRIYKYLRQCEETLSQDIQLNNNALNILQGQVPTDSESQKQLIYQNFYVDYEQTLINYITLLLSLIK